MMITHKTTSNPKSAGLAAVLLVILFIFILILAPTPISTQAANVQPELLALAAEEPETAVRVIIQVSDPEANLSEAITRVNGRVLQDLHFIQAIAAELPAKAIPGLAHMAGVNRVSLDRALMSGQIAENISFYLQNNPFPSVGKTTSQSILPLSTIPPVTTTLYNLDTNRDAFPGLLISKGGSSYSTTDLTKIQRWQLAKANGDLQLSGEAALTIFTAMKDFNTGKTGKLQAYLLDSDGSQRQLIAQGSVTNSNWNGSWQPLTINFGLLNYTVPANHQLELALLVDGSSGDDMWLAYGTETHFSNLTINQVNLTTVIRDAFNNAAYDNNNGSKSWATDWVETNDDGSPGSGDIAIYQGELMLKDDSRSIHRSVNLADAATAVLSLDYRRYSFDRSSDYVAIQISTNDGDTWAELGRFAGPANDSSLQTASFDITQYLPNNIVIRLAASSELSNYDRLYIDNIQIEFEPVAAPNNAPAPVEPPPTGETAITRNTVRDEFSQASWTNNNGTLNWSTPWTGYDYGGSGANDGYVYVQNGRFIFHYAYAYEEYAVRSADLSGSTEATLSYDWQTVGLDSGETISVLVSQDGQQFSELAAYGGSQTGSASFDISGYIGSATTIRIENRSSHWESGEYAFFDNIQIKFGVSAPEPTPTPAPVQPTPTEPPPAEPESNIFRDEFSNLLYDGNNGTVNWSDAWQELNESDGPGSGLARVVSDTRCAAGYCIRLGANADDGMSFGSRGLKREADLSGAQSATLTFDYQRRASSGTAVVTLAVSGDGGMNWNNLASYPLNNSDAGPVAQSFDISDYIAANTQVRLIGSGSIPEESSTYFYIDNIQIETSTPVSEVTNEPTLNHYLQTTNAQMLWEKGIQGQGVTVAVIDSGISPSFDFGDRLLAQVSFNADAQSANDTYGHGTHVAGIIGGSGANSNGLYKGIAPQVNLISLKVSDDQGMAYESDTVAAMQWVLENKDTYNIRVVNLSLNSTLKQSYHESALDLASELLWFNGVVVVASAGNRSLDGNFYTITASPANDPFIITVGASTESNTDSIDDDAIALFSAHGTTVNGFDKPDIIAPGYQIVSVLSGDSNWDIDNPERIEGDGDYFRLSGTSMAAPIVSGAAALLLQAEPNLTPDQVKYRLMNTGNTIAPVWFDAILDKTIYPYLDVNAAIDGTTTESANQGVMPHIALAKMALIAYWASENGAETIDWSNIDWNSVNWDNVDWDAVDWGSVNWGSVNWGSVNWGSVNWGSVNWGSVNWGSVNWGSVNWGSVNWGSVNWGSVNWGSVNWGSVNWGSVSWDN